MKFGILCSYNEILNRETVEKIKQEGIKIVELHRIPEKVGYENINAIKDEFDYSLHASVKDLRINLLDFNYPKSIINKIEKEVEFAITLGANEFILHAGSFFKGYILLSKILRKNIGLNHFLNIFAKTFGPMLKKAHENGVRVLIENCYPCYLLGRPYDIIYLQKKLPFLRFCLDLAHSEIYNQTEELMKLDIDHVHLTDNNKKRDQHLKIGEGSIDFEYLLKRLKEKNYSKKIIFESLKLQDCMDSYKKINSLKF